jgi:transposase
MEKKILRQNVGIDISKDDFKASFSVISDSLIVTVQGSRTFANSRSGFKAFRAWIASKHIAGLAVHFTMEATGVYYEALAYDLYEHGFVVHIVLPNQSKKYGQSLGIKSKTDKLDASVLAQMGLERQLRHWQPPTVDLLVLKQLTRERDSLVRERTSASNHLHAYLHQGKPNRESIKRTEKHIVFLDGQIKQIENEIKSFVKEDEALKEKFKYLLSIPGVGIITAAVVVAETHGFAAIENIKQLTSYAGLDVKIAESGKWKGQSKISKKGNSHIRKVLYMSSLAKIRSDEATAKFADRLKQKKGKAIIAIVAVERKLLALMYVLWKKEEMYNVNHSNSAE